jgi:PAS domain S-box-containing protein
VSTENPSGAIHSSGIASVSDHAAGKAAATDSALRAAGATGMVAFRPKMKLSLGTKVAIAVGVALASIIALGGLQYRAARGVVEDNRWVSHTQDVLREIEATEKGLNDADACAQSFVISGDTSSLAVCQQGAQGIAQHLQNLRLLTQDSPDQQHRLAGLEALMGNTLRVIQQEIDLRRSGQLSESGLADLESLIRRSVGEVRADAAEMQTVELDVLRHRRQAALASDREINWMIIIGSLAAFVLVGVSGIALWSDMAARRRAERTLLESEERFRLIVEAVQDYAIFGLDPKGRVVTWNAGAERIKGYKTLEILGKHLSNFYSEEDVASGKPHQELELAAREGRCEIEGWRVRKDGTRFWSNAVVTALRDDLGRLIGFTNITRDVTERMLAQKAIEESREKLETSEKSLHELSMHLLRLQDEERKRIGQEMHDSLGQYLSVLKMKLDSMTDEERHADADAITQELETCAALADDCVKEVRTISYLLYPPMLDELGLKSAAPWYLDGFSRRSGIQTSFEISQDFERLPRDVELILFRILQESLTNVHRHSGSRTANVRLRREANGAILEVTDCGKGLPAEIVEEAERDWVGTPGVGLRSMSHRLRQFGGKLELISTGSGTLLRAAVPLIASTRENRATNFASA